MRFRFAQALAVLGLAALIGACGSLPRPFAHTELAPPGPLVDLQGGAGVRVHPLQGVPEKFSTALAEAFAEHLRQANIPATTAGTFRAGYVLGGYVEPREEEGSDAALAKLVWTLRDGDEKLIGSFSQVVRGDAAGWAEVDPKLIQTIVGDVAGQIAGLLQARSTPPPPPPARRFFVKPIAWRGGAANPPADRPIVLRNALVHALSRAGAVIAEKESEARAVIKGGVTVGPEEDGARLVSILWRVRHPAGRPVTGEIGKIRQANRVTVSRLGGEWGDLALAAALGAAQGIVDLADRAALFGK